MTSPVPTPHTRLNLDTALRPLDALGYGGDYNPEQWPEDVWAEDARLMQEAGVNLISLGIFSWAKIEPTPGARDFGWLDRVLDVLHRHGVQVNLATATASPPPWMAHQDPSSLPVTADGVRLSVGARQQYCPSSVSYREGCERLTRDIAERYGQHPALAAWHVNNEYGCHIWECFCEACAGRFRTWLRQKYGDVERMNTAWGTAFWSQHYASWEEVGPPRRVNGFINPTQQLDWRRFSSDNILELYSAEVEILREVTPEVPVATNFLGFLKGLDYWKWGRQQDFIATDVYTDPAEPEAFRDGALSYDLARSLGLGAPWALMEQTSSLVNWRPVNVMKGPGVMRLWSLQAVARGADAVMFFQWRASRAGAEKYHGAMLPHGGPETRVHQEIRGLGQDLLRLKAVRGSRVRAKVAVLHDWDNWWALELDSKPSASVRQLERVSEHHRALHRMNLTADLAHPEQDLQGYGLVVIPNQYLLTDRAAENIRSYVEAGGTAVLGFFSGIVDEHDHIRLSEPAGGYPAPWRSLLGLSMDEFDPQPTGTRLTLNTPEGLTLAADLWAEVIRPQGAEVLATFNEGFYAGSPAVTRHRAGLGQIFYVGTRLAPEGLDWLLGQAAQEAGVAPDLDVPAGVEVLTRCGEHDFLFVLNHNAKEITVQVPAGLELLSGERVAGPLSIAGTGLAVVQLDREG
ncbi:beta-galactosidase [Deinococcus sp. UYEF24]